MQIPIPQRDGAPEGFVHVQRKGTGPVLILIHGFPLHSGMWANQIGLAEHFDLVIPDLRGFGQSSELPDDWTMEQFARDLHQMMAALNISRAVICGLSLGGYIAFEFYSLFAFQTAGLVLCNTRSAADDQAVRRGRRLMADRVLREGTDFVAESMIPKLISSANLNAELAPPVIHLFRNLKSDSIARTQIAMGQRKDYGSVLGQIQCPVQVIAGDDDVITPANEMHQMAHQIPNVEFELIEQAGHLTPIENPFQFNRALKKKWNSP